MRRIPNPVCDLCYESLANDAMKPAKLKQYLESKHKYMGKCIEFFERKRDELNRHMIKKASQSFVPGENAKSTEGSYMVSLLNAGTPHSIGENLIKSAAKVIADILLGEKASTEIHKVPLSNDTVQQRIAAIAENI